LPKDFYLLIFYQTNQDQYTSNNRGKAKILIKRFFSGVGQANLQNTSNQTYPLPLNISYIILAKEIKNIIQKLPISKALRPDKTPNKAIKVTSEELAIPFINATTACL